LVHVCLNPRYQQFIAVSRHHHSPFFKKLAPLSAARIAASAFMNSIGLQERIMFGNSCICMHPEPVLTDIAAIRAVVRGHANDAGNLKWRGRHGETKSGI
jgi:hypothetical protein